MKYIMQRIILLVALLVSSIVNYGEGEKCVTPTDASGHILTNPSNISICNTSDQDFTAQIKLPTGYSAEALTVQVELPSGILYVPGSMKFQGSVYTGTDGAFVSNPSFVFNTSGLSAGDVIDLAFQAYASCSIDKSQFEPHFSITTPGVSITCASEQSFDLNEPHIRLYGSEGLDASLQVFGLKGDVLTREYIIDNSNSQPMTESITLDIIYHYPDIHDIATVGGLASIELQNVIDGEIKESKMITTTDFEQFVDPADGIEKKKYTFTISTDDYKMLGFTDVSGNNGQLAGNGAEEIRVVEKIDILNCSEGVLNTFLTASWYCSSDMDLEQICNKPKTDGAQFNSGYQQEQENNSLAFNSTVVNIATYNDAGLVRYEIENNGTRPLSQIINSFSTSSNIEINWIKKDGIELPIIDPAGSNIYALQDAFETLSEGSVIILEVNYTVTCNDNCGLNTHSISHNLSYVDEAVCTTKTAFVNILDIQSANAPTLLDGPVDLISGESEQIFKFKPSISLGSKKLLKNCDTDNIFVELEITDHVLPVAGSVKYTAVVNNVSEEYILEFERTGNVLRIDPQPGVSLPYNGLDGEYEIALKIDFDCEGSLSASTGFEIATWSLKNECVEGGTPVCIQTLDCKEWEYFAHYKCTVNGISGTSCVLINSGFDVYRNTFGYDKSTIGNATLSDYKTEALITQADVNANPDDYETNKAYAYDLITAKSSASINCDIEGSKLNVHLTYAPPKIPVDENDLMNLLDYYTDNFSAKIVGTNTYLSEAPVVTWNPDQEVILLDFSFQSVPTIVAGSYNFLAQFKVRDTYSDEDEHLIRRLRGEWMLNLGAALPVFGAYGKGDKFYIYDTKVSVKEFPTSNSSGLCQQSHKITLDVTGGNAGEDFKNEFRPVSNFNSFSYTLPTGYSYISGTSVITALGTDYPLTIAPTIVDNVVTWTRNSEWPFMDKVASSNKMELRFSLSASKDITDNSTAFSYNFARTDFEFSQTQTLDDVTGSNTTNAGRKLPKIQFKNVNTVYASGKNAEFEFFVDNYSTTAPNAWIAIEAETPNISLVGVQIEEAGKFVDASDMIPYGANNEKLYFRLNSLKNAYRLKLKVNYTDCNALSAPEGVKVYSGWSCNDDFPTVTSSFDPNTNINNDISWSPVSESTLNFQQQAAGLDIKLKTPSQHEFYDLCTTVQYHVQLEASGNSDISNPELWIDLPEGLSLIGNVTYSIPDKGVDVGDNGVLSFAPGVNPVNVKWDLAPLMPNTEGNLELLRPIDIKFNVASTCDYNPLSHVLIYGDGKTLCGDPIPDSNKEPESRRVGLKGLEEIENIAIEINASPILKPYASSDVEVKLTNTSDNVAELKDIRVEFSLTGDVEFSGVMLNGTQYPDIVTPNLLVWTSIDITTSKSLWLQLDDVSDPELEAEATLTAKTVSDKVLSCAGNSLGCPVNILTAEISTILDLPKKGPLTGDPMTCANCIGSFKPIDGNEYILSAWAKEMGTALTTISYTAPVIEVSFDGVPKGDNNPVRFTTTGKIIEGWQKVEGTFLLPVGTQNIRFKLLNESGGPDVFYDDIRIHNVDGNMKSFVYDPISLKLLAELDENNYATFYEYDKSGALIRVKKETERGVQTIQENRSNTIKISDPQ